MSKLQPVLAVLLMSSYLPFRAAESTCNPAEQGQPYSMQCEVPQGELPLTWRIGDGLDNAYCQCSYNDVVKFCDIYKPGVSATVSASGSNVISNFTINSPQRSQTGITWTCASSGSTVYKTCHFIVFDRAKNVSCEVVEPPEPTSNTSVTVRCQADDIYPPADTACLFYKKTGGNTRTNLTAGTNGVTVETVDKQCTLRVAGTSLDAGDYQFGVVMYPDITVDDTDIQYGVTSPDTRTIKIGAPSAGLSQCRTAASDGSSVLDDYVKNGTINTCTCTRTDQTYFPVVISWKDNNGGAVSVGNQSPESATLTFTADRNQAFTCSVKNSLMVTKNVIYQPQVAYGPIRVDVTLVPANQGPVDLCQGNADVSFPVQCQVSSPGVVPSATFSYTVNTTTSSVVAQTPTDDSTGSATVTVTQGGVHSITCLAKNFKFEDINTQNTVSVVVTAPPSAPTIKISQRSSVSPTTDTILTLEEGEADVTCSVMGGYPQVTELRLSCGKNETFTNQGNQAQMSVIFTRNMNGASCSCLATHDSKCYDHKEIVHMLNILYAPAVLTFTANESSSPVTVEKGSTLTFVCEADGNPHPSLSLQHDGKGNVTSVSDGDTTVTKLTHNQPMDCLDTGVYKCTALANGREDNHTVKVNVMCRQQLEPSQSQNTVYKGQVNGTFSINVTVYGHPKPKSLQLDGHKKELQQDDYNVTYTETRPPHGNIKITFYSLTEEYFQNYTLTVNNTEGSLVYNFRISGDVGSSDGDGSMNIAAIAGGIAAAILVILIVVLVVFIMRRKGLSCGKKQESSRKSHDDEVEHVITNDLYSGGSNSGEVVVDNSDLYSGNWNRKSNEVVIDNSDLYSGNWKQESNEVVVDNSALYGKSDDFKATREALYKNYSDITTSITSATAAPVRDMKTSNGAKQGGNSSYEDVEVGAKPPGPSAQAKPKVAVKPMTAAKPTPAPKPSGPSASGQQGNFALQNDGGDQTYASVIKTGKPQAPNTQPVSQRESDYFPDQSKKPEVPEKKYEQEESLTGQEGKKKEQKKPSADKKNKNKKADEIPMVPQDGAAGSSSHDNPYVNGGFTEDNGNVYANARGNKSRKD